MREDGNAQSSGKSTLIQREKFKKDNKDVKNRIGKGRIKEGLVGRKGRSAKSVGESVGKVGRSGQSK